MGLFRSYSSSSPDNTDDQTLDAAGSSDATGKKGVPTPSRKEAERLRLERLHPTLTKKERKQREREISRIRSDRAYEEMERRPERVLLRNFIDSRWTMSEFTWPFMFLALAMLLAGGFYPLFSIVAQYLVWFIFLVIVMEGIFLWWQFKRVLTERLPYAPRKGLGMYMFSRMITMRRFRRPPTALNRGDDY